MGGAQAAQGDGHRHRGKLEPPACRVNDHAMLEGDERAAQAPARRQESTALFGTARLWDDGVIDPRDTRRMLGLCLDLARRRPTRRQLRPNTFGVARL